jgi:AcrR family transcriptional regulator
MSEPGGARRGTLSGDRGKIITAFVALVAQRGYHELDPAEVGERAGLGAEAFAEHFPDRLGCFEAAWDCYERIYLERIEAAYAKASDWRSRLRAAAMETARLVERWPDQARFMVVETLAVGEQGRHRQQALGARIAKLLDGAFSHLDDPSAIPPATSAWVTGMFFDRIYRCLSTERGADLAAQIPQLMFLAVSSYFGPEEGLSELRVSEH